MLCVSVSIGMHATINVYSTMTTNYIGSSAVSGYGIYGAEPGEIAQLLAGTYPGTVHWNDGSSLDALKSAALVKIGSDSDQTELTNDDLAALANLQAQYIDIDGCTLATGASITEIRASSNILAVSLPHNLTKTHVNQAGAALTACNPNFGSCVSQSPEMETKEVTTYWYNDPCSSITEPIQYTGTVTDNKGTVENITRPLTLTGSSFSYVNTKFKNTVTTCSASDVVDGYIVPNPLKVELTRLSEPKTTYTTVYNGVTISVPDHGLSDDKTKTKSFYSSEINETVPADLDVTAAVSNYSYTFKKGGWEQTFYYSGTPQGDETNGYYAMIENVYANYGNDGYQFSVTSTYNYTYIDLNCNEVEVSYNEEKETIDLAYNQEVTLTPVTESVTRPKEGGKTDVIAYVNTEGTLYMATNLAPVVAANVENVTISGNINNADIAQNSGAADPSKNKNDADKFDETGEPAFYLSSSAAPIKSMDLSDCVIDNYKHLRVLSNNTNLEKIVFPKTLTKIPNYCCNAQGTSGNFHLKEVVFPTEASTFTIGDYAFYGTAIKSLLIPSGVTLVGDYAFATCPNITDVEMEALHGDCHFGNNVFNACGALKHVTLSEKVQNIGDCMFLQCGLLESIRIPSTCKTIGEEAFKLCYSIHEITIPEGVEEIKMNAFENAGLTDIYVMADEISKLPKIYAISPGGDGPSTFSYQRTTGNNTVPTNHRDDLSTSDYDTVISWYQEEQSGSEGLGTGNCLTALHYPESMKPFYEAIDVTQFYTAEQLATIPHQTLYGTKRYYTPSEYIALAAEGYQATLTAIINNQMLDGSGAAATFLDEDGNTVDYKYLPQTYGVDPVKDGGNTTPFGPDKDKRYYPSQTSYLVRMVAGATSTQAGGKAGAEVASAWGWRQFPLAISIEDQGEIPFEKEYDDTWYTMCFPWKMEDNQLFSAFNQKCEIVEFVGAEMLPVDGSDTEFNLVFHFDEVAQTYYMDNDNVEYTRERDGDRVDAAGHKLYVFTPKNGGASISAPDPIPDKNSTDTDAKEQYGKYLTIKNIMVLPGHPYMIHPSIGAKPGNPATVYINGVKKVEVGDGKEFATYEALAEANKVTRTVTSNEKGGTSTTAWTNPAGNSGGKYSFKGNINDAVETDGVSDGGKQSMPLPCYFLGVSSSDHYYPRYYRKKTGGVDKWSQYSAIIIPDETAKANVEPYFVSASGSSTSAKSAGVVFGDYNFDEMEVIDDAGIATVINEAVEKDKSSEVIHIDVVYNINGQIVRADSGSVEGLPKGIYIVNGKKYMVK